jgi:DNA repair photolyase
VRPIDNPPNPFASVEREWLEEPPAVRLEVYEEESQSILSANDSPDVPFRWSVNPYRGCFHACAYCYARPTHEYLGFGAGTDFESRIVVKSNAPQLLRRAFDRSSWNGELVAFSGNTDCYQPLEAVWRLTRACLEICAEYRNPVGVITRSLLVQRDIDVLQRLHAEAGVHVYFSIPFVEDALARAIEPQGIAHNRIQAIRQQWRNATLRLLPPDPYHGEDPARRQARDQDGAGGQATEPHECRCLHGRDLALF